MRTILIATVLSLLTGVASAQSTTIIIDPLKSRLVWDVPGADVPTAQGCAYAVSISGAAAVPVTGAVTCVAPIAPATLTACSTLLNTATTPPIPLGSNSLTMQMTCSGVLSAFSLPFAYVDMLVPIPANIRIR